LVIEKRVILFQTPPPFPSSLRTYLPEWPPSVQNRLKEREEQKRGYVSVTWVTSWVSPRASCPCIAGAAWWCIHQHSAYTCTHTEKYTVLTVVLYRVITLNYFKGSAELGVIECSSL